MSDNTDILNSYCRIRKLIGILGFLLPILIVIFYGDFLPSISHYYYTRSALFFIAILAAFGFFLISYRGYKEPENKKKKWRLSDDFVTHVGGFAVLIVVLLPTACTDKVLEICTVCPLSGFCLFGHKNLTINIFHLISAAIFFLSMAYMSISNFTRGNDKKYHVFYTLCGWIIIGALGLLFIEFLIRIKIDNFNLTGMDVYILETIMVFSFAISWLLKGRTIEYVTSVLHRVKREIRLKEDGNK